MLLYLAFLCAQLLPLHGAGSAYADDHSGGERATPALGQGRWPGLRPGSADLPEPPARVFSCDSQHEQACVGIEGPTLTVMDESGWQPLRPGSSDLLEPALGGFPCEKGLPEEACVGIEGQQGNVNVGEGDAPCDKGGSGCTRWAVSRFNIDDGSSLTIGIGVRARGEIYVSALVLPGRQTAGIHILPAADEGRLDATGPEALPWSPARGRAISLWAGDAALTLAAADDANGPRGGDHGAREVGAKGTNREESTSLTKIRKQYFKLFHERVLALHDYLAGPRGDSEADIVGILEILGGGSLPAPLSREFEKAAALHRLCVKMSSFCCGDERADRAHPSYLALGAADRGVRAERTSPSRPALGPAENGAQTFASPERADCLHGAALSCSSMHLAKPVADLAAQIDARPRSR